MGASCIPFLASGFEVIVSEFACFLVWLLLVTFFFFFNSNVNYQGRKIMMPFQFSILTQKSLFLYSFNILYFLQSHKTLQVYFSLSKLRKQTW